MIRRLFTATSVFSLVLCVATMGLWFRTYWRVYDVFYSGPLRQDRARDVRIDLHRGLLFVGDATAFIRPESEADFDRSHFEDDPAWHTGWRVETGDAVAYSSRAALIKGLWKFEAESRDLQTPTSNPAALVLKVHHRHVWFPLWVLALVFAAWPGVRGFALWGARCRRRAHGACLHCGYDLRASANRCPECGASIPPKVST